MGDIVSLGSLGRSLKPVRDAVPASGAVILLFTGVQYMRERAAEMPCATDVEPKTPQPGLGASASRQRRGGQPFGTQKN